MACRCGGMVDAADSKSAPSNRVLVRVQSSAIKPNDFPHSAFFFLPASFKMHKFDTISKIKKVALWNRFFR